MERIVGVECFADEYFFKRLLRNDRIVRKEKNKEEVLKSVLERSKGNFSVGIVDADSKDFGKQRRSMEAYLKGLDIERKIDFGSTIQVVKVADKPWFFIQLAPVEFEQWIVKFLDDFCEKKLADFGFESALELCGETKVIPKRLLANEKVMTSFNYVLNEFQKTDNHVRKLKEILDYLIEMNYQADINEIANG
jgi:hypothetical protein